jgi:hypothetical protein
VLLEQKSSVIAADGHRRHDRSVVNGRVSD